MEEKIIIQEMQNKLYLYQAFEIFVIFGIEIFQDDGWNADDMELDKMRTFMTFNTTSQQTHQTVKLLSVIALN